LQASVCPSKKKEDTVATQSDETTPEAREVDLSPSERAELVTKKATCPFLGSAIATQQLPVRNHPQNPLASVQDVIDLGNTGGGDLGKVLGFFASGNHGRMRSGPAGTLLDTQVPAGLFSLDLPGSQGSHAGHSGILQGSHPARLGPVQRCRSRAPREKEPRRVHPALRHRRFHRRKLQA